MAVEFDDELSFEENLEKFLSYLEQQDPKHGRILREEIAPLQQIPEQAAPQVARSAFNDRIRRKILSEE